MRKLRTRPPAAGGILIAVLALWSAGCAVPEMPQQPAEVLLFTEIGAGPAQDSVSVIAPDGSNFNLLLPRQPNRSFLFAHGDSLKTHLLVLAHELTTSQKIEDRLYLYHHGSGELRQLVTADGDAGFAGLAPGSGRVAFEFAPADKPAQIQIWITDLAGQARNLTSPGENQIDRFPVWRPDGSEIWFLRVQFALGKVESSLMAVSPAGGEPQVVVGPAEHVGAMAFGADNARFALWTNRGLELVDAATLARTVILPASSIPGFVLQAGSLVWSRKQDLLALSLVNTQTGASELWTVAADGANPRPIYHVNSGRLFLGAFVEP